MKMFENNLLLQYKIFPKALNKNNAVSRPPMAMTFSLSSLLSAFPYRRHWDLQADCDASENTPSDLLGFSLFDVLDFEPFCLPSSFFGRFNFFVEAKGFSVKKNKIKFNSHPS